MTSIAPAGQFTLDALLCDSAVVSDGKLFVQGGGWTILNVPSVPAQLPRLGIGIIITVPYTATNQNHILGIELKTEDGDPVLVGGVAGQGDPSSVPVPQQPLKAEAQFNVGRPPIISPGDSQALCFALNLDGVQIASPGGFVVVLSIDGTEIRTLNFRVLSAANPNIGVR